MTKRVVALAAMLLVSGVAVAAHHSISGAYDTNRSVTVEATVTRFRFINPHPFLDAEVKDPSGATQVWQLELDNRGELAGIGVTAETFKAGDRVAVSGSASRINQRSLYVRKLVRPADGFEYEQVGSSPRIRQR